MEAADKEPDSIDPTSAALPKDGLLDPEKLDATEKSGRNRKIRNRPEPKQELRDWETKAEARAFKREHPPGIILEPAGLDRELWTAPHNDDALWTLQLADAFGTRSQAVFTTFLRQLEKLCDSKIWDEDAQQWRLDEHEFSAALAMVNTIKPRNEMEAALAAQMVAVHVLTMKLAARAVRYDYDTKTVAVASKLARTFVMQTEALNNLRGKRRTARQSIKVSRETHHHQHIHVHRGANENDGQPHGRGATVVDQCAALSGPDQARDGVSLPSDEKQTGVPHSRGQKSWSPKG